MSYRFYPLAEDLCVGVLAKGEHRDRPKPKVAEFLTLEQAKAIQQRKERAA